MQRVDDVRIGRMEFGALLVMLEETGALKGWRARRVTGGMTGQDVLAEVVEGRASERRWGPDKGHIHHARMEPDDFEELRPLVPVERRDAHLGQHLEGAVLECTHIVLLRGAPVGCLSFEMTRGGEGPDRGEAEPRTDRLRPVAEQADHMVDLARFVG